MDTEEETLSRCTFCSKNKDESELIEMSTNSIIINGEIIEFENLFEILFDAKVCLLSLQLPNYKILLCFSSIT